MKNLKKIAALLLAMALVLSLFAACGNDSGSSGSSTPESSTASGESSEEAPESSEASTGDDDGETCRTSTSRASPPSMKS